MEEISKWVPATPQNPRKCKLCQQVLSLATHYGILQHCSHMFCLRCICTSLGLEAKIVDDSVRISTIKQPGVKRKYRCPVCQKFSLFVVPSKKLPTSEAEREEIIQQFTETDQATLCILFNPTTGSCFYGDKCTFRHE